MKWIAILAAVAVAATAAAAAAVVPSSPVRLGDNGVELVVIEHASLVLRTATASIWVDPVGVAADYEADWVDAPDIILVTHPHADHFSASLIASVATASTIVIGPSDVTTPLSTTVGFLGTTRTIQPTNVTAVGAISISAIAAYNLDPNTAYHRKDANWNGYILNVDGEVIYFSGDTEDTPEMRSLRGISFAFLCMNLPYTMTMDSAANATIEFAPKNVIPYHHRGQDTAVFRDLVNAGDASINVLLLDWYPAKADTTTH